MLTEIRSRMPEKFNDYYEPFVGGGALLLDLQPSKATINDVNTALINAYNAIKQDPKGLISGIKKLDNEQLVDPKAFFYDRREEYNKLISANKYDVETASLFIYINKHCFNGLYRVNAHGGFNVPFNGSKRLSIDEGNVLAISEFLQEVTILNKDFEEACGDAKEGDFIFFDSPYAPLKSNTFEAYTKEGFTLEDHRRLANLYKELSNKGCYCMLTNHNTDLVNELYHGFKIDVVQVKRSINSKASKRTGTEVIIRNY